MIPKLWQSMFLMMPPFGSHDDKMMFKKPTKIRHKERPKMLKPKQSIIMPMFGSQDAKIMPKDH